MQMSSALVLEGVLKGRVLFAFMLLLVSATSPALAQSIVGQWQGTVEGQPGEKFRYVVTIARNAAGDLDGQIYNIDTGTDATPIGIAHEGRSLQFVIGGGVARYEGEISTDGSVINGTYTQTRSQPLILTKATPETTWTIDPTSHAVSFVTTSDGVKLEVVDWGGHGKPLVFISGLSSTAHIFDKFAPLLAQHYRVYGVTRRGWGASDKPDPTKFRYDSDRLGDDVLEIITQLKIERPVLAGFSMGGAEMSSIASRHPDRVAGLIYLDAAYAYAWYTPGTPLSLNVLANDFKAKVNRINTTGVPPEEATRLVDELLQTTLPHLETELEANRRSIEARARGTLAALPAITPPGWAIADAIIQGSQRYSDLKAIPVLAIFATPQARPPNAPPAMLASLERQEAAQIRLIELFEAGNPAARVVRIANAQHAVFRSHPTQVASEITAFLDSLD